jgi:hypothetical protein
MKISFDSSPEFDALMDELQDQTGINKKSLLVAGAVFLSWAIRQKLAGRDIASVRLGTNDVVGVYNSETLMQAEMRGQAPRPAHQIIPRIPAANRPARRKVGKGTRVTTPLKEVR